jgi:hypothetical protein
VISSDEEEYEPIKTPPQKKKKVRQGDSETPEVLDRGDESVCFNATLEIWSAYHEQPVYRTSSVLPTFAQEELVTISRNYRQSSGKVCMPRHTTASLFWP